jgi:hypothetical protein
MAKTCRDELSATTSTPFRRCLTSTSNALEKGGNDLYGYRIDENSITEGSTLRKWLMNTFTVNNLIDDNVNLRPRILFEEIPSGQKYLEPIIEAMRDNHVIEITYFSLDQNEESTFEVEPLCVKIFQATLVSRGTKCIVRSKTDPNLWFGTGFKT